MKQITVTQARELLAINESIYLIVGNEIQEITRENLLTSDAHGNRAYYPFNRETIKMLIKQLMGIDTLSWQYLANDRGLVMTHCKDFACAGLAQCECGCKVCI